MRSSAHKRLHAFKQDFPKGCGIFQRNEGEHEESYKTGYFEYVSENADSFLGVKSGSQVTVSQHGILGKELMPRSFCLLTLKPVPVFLLFYVCLICAGHI